MQLISLYNNSTLDPRRKVIIKWWLNLSSNNKQIAITSVYDFLLSHLEIETNISEEDISDLFYLKDIIPFE